MASQAFQDPFHREPEKLKTSTFSLPYGVLLGLILIVITVLMYVTGMIEEEKQWPVYIYYLIFPIFIGYSIYAYRNKNIYLSLSEALKVGISVAFISGAVYGIYNLIYMYFIEPDTVEKVVQIAEEKLANQNMSESQIEENLKFVRRFANPWFASSMFILLSIAFGFVYSLISGVIFKKDKPVHY